MSGPPPAGSAGVASGPVKTKHWRQSPHAKANDFRKQPWYQQDASTAVAAEILMTKKRGDFILRFAPERMTNPAMKDDFVLSVKGEDKVYHVLLHAEQFEGHQYYHVKPTGHCFQDMFDIVKFGSKFPFHFPGSDGSQLQITLNVPEVQQSKIVTAKQGLPTVSEEAPHGGIVRRLSTAFSDKDEMEKWISALQAQEEQQLNKVHQKQRDAELKAKKDEADKEAAAAAKAHAEAEARASHEQKIAAQEKAAQEKEEQMRAEREYEEKTERERRALAKKMGKPTHEPNQAHNHPLDTKRDLEQFSTLKRIAGKKGTPLLPDVNSQFDGPVTWSQPQ